MINGHSFSSSQFNLPVDLSSKVKEVSRKIPDFSLHGDGRESEPHVTVKYGLHTQDPNDLRDVLKGHPKFKIKLGSATYFPDSGDGDVVKVDIHSPELHKLHRKISDSLKTSSSFRDYKPHITLAYVKPGMGPAMASKIGDSLKGHEATVDHVMFSDKQHKHTRIPLGNGQQYKVNYKGDR